MGHRLPVDTPPTLSSSGLKLAAMREALERDVPHLVIVWSRDQPHRVGEAATLLEPCVLGRGPPRLDDPSPRTVFCPQRPGGAPRGAPLEGSRISRRQLELVPLPDGALEVRSVGRCPLILHGEVVERGIVRPGDTVTLQKALVLLVVARRSYFQPLRAYPDGPLFPFGAADPHGIVGESPAAWALRDALAFAAKAGSHVLVLGESGVGKELAARAVHALSPQRDGPFVARNASTFPEGLIDAELFGTAKGYPNGATPERRGLIGEVDGGTLFLDEISTLPKQLQAHLLRVLDRGGEYQRLGETRVRRSCFRMVAATNQPDALKHDLGARFTIRIEVPGLDRRPEDVPLLLRHLLDGLARSHPDLFSRSPEQRAGALAEVRVDPRVIDALVRHRFTLHTRELERLMWVGLTTSPHDVLTLTPALRAELRLDEPLAERRTPAPGDDEGRGEPAREQAADPGALGRAGLRPRSIDARPTDPSAIGRATIEAALAETRHSVTEAARLLGLKNRFALYRLMKQHGVANPKGDPTGG